MHIFLVSLVCSNKQLSPNFTTLKELRKPNSYKPNFKKGSKYTNMDDDSLVLEVVRDTEQFKNDFPRISPENQKRFDEII